MAEPGYNAIASEVVELGENLFELALKRPTAQISDNTTPDGELLATSEQEQVYLTEEMRIAADEFFAALRLLLGLQKNNQ